MKGVVLAGGQGTRLRPTTRVVNKHFLPVYDKPMVFYPIETLAKSGIEEILIISTPGDTGKFKRLIEHSYPNEHVEFSYRVQKEPKGIAHGLKLAEEFVDGDFAMVLGDNLIFQDLSEDFNRFRDSASNAQVFLKQVDDPSQYGIACFDSEGDISEVIEKPSSPTSDKAIIGLYLYDEDVFDKVAQITPSEREEYEITDVNRIYLQEGELDYSLVNGEWFDVGTPAGILGASNYVRRYRRGDE